MPEQREQDGKPGQERAKGSKDHADLLDPVLDDQGGRETSEHLLEFTRDSTIVTFHLSAVTRMQPYENAIDIYEKGKKEAYKFMWGNKINMKLTGIPGDDGKVKPLAGWIVAQFIINERNRVGNLLKAK